MYEALMHGIDQIEGGGKGRKPKLEERNRK